MRHDNKLSYDQHFWELPGTKIWFQNLLEKSRENMNVKEQNQTAAILAGLKKCKKRKKQITGVWKIVWCDNNVMISSILGGGHTY